MQILSLDTYKSDLSHYIKHGPPETWNIGWVDAAEVYRPSRRYMSIVTGIPGHGKSEWVDAILVNMAARYDLKFCYFSPENFPVHLHAIKLAEKYKGMNHNSMTEKASIDAHRWVNEHFRFLNPTEENLTIDGLLSLFKEVKESFGCDGIVIDPWNEVDHKRPDFMSESEYISMALSKIRRFSRTEDVHSWIIAHPTKMQKDLKTGEYPAPTPYDISGAAHWRNKADFCITVHRPDFKSKDNAVEVHLMKVKFKHFGKLGSIKLKYDWKSGCYYEGDTFIHSVVEKVPF